MIVLLLTVLVVGPAFTRLTENSYFLHPATFLYFPRNLSLKWLQYDLPGVFRNNPYGPPINGSIWTLFYEAACYCMVAIVGALALTRRSWRFFAFLVTYGLGYVALKLIGKHLLENALVANFHQLTLPFVLGMAFYQFRRFVPLNLIVCVFALAAAALTYQSSWFREIFVISWCYSIFYLGYLPFAPLKAYNYLGDYSYGMYLYAFPCEQIGAALWEGIAPLALIAMSFPVTLAFAVLSWHFLESWALGQRAAVARWLTRKFVRTGRTGTAISPERSCAAKPGCTERRTPIAAG